MKKHHYTIEELELYRHGKMSLLGKIACGTHLKSCKECQKQLETLKADDQFLTELTESVKLYQD